MPTNVDIIIKGVAVCYIKNSLWNVIFPFDKCHTLQFSHRKDDDELINVGHLARAKSKIAITITPAPSSPATGRSGKFNNSVYDLTFQSSAKPGRVTHRKVKRKLHWENSAVWMTIQNATMFVLDYIQDYIQEDLFLDDGRTTPMEDSVAHSLRARVKLNPGEKLELKIDGALVFDTIVAPPPPDDILYTLIFDNDCQDNSQEGNDMEMFYRVVEDDTHPRQKFKIRAGDKASGGHRVIPPDLHGGKPCMSAFVSNPTDSTIPANEQLP